MSHGKSAVDVVARLQRVRSPAQGNINVLQHYGPGATVNIVVRHEAWRTSELALIKDRSMNPWP